MCKVYILPLLLLASCAAAPTLRPAECQVVIDNPEVLFSDRIEIDLSQVSSRIHYKDRLIFSHWNSGKVVEYRMSDGAIKSIGVEGRGPYEFSGLVSLVRSDNILFMFDIAAGKMVEYDLDAESFVREYSLNALVYGALIFATVDDESTSLYFTPQRRDRSKSNDTFVYLLKFDTSTQLFDTLASAVDNHMLSHWDEDRKMDSGFHIQTYVNRIYTVFRDELHFVDTDQFIIRSFEKPETVVVDVDFSYLPDYESYIQGYQNMIRTNDPSEFAAIRIEMMNKAIEGSSRKMEGLFSSILTSDSYLLFSLFGDTSAYLWHNLQTSENHVVCADKSMTPLLIVGNDIYWRRQGDVYVYDLVKTTL